jgi:putative ABC transport system permease protein
MRGGLRRLSLMAACLWLSLTAFMTLGLLLANVEQGIRDNAKAILGGDVAISQPHLPLQESLLEELRKEAAISHRLELRTMVESASSRQLTELQVVEDNYPLVGEIILSPAISLSQALAVTEGEYGMVAEKSLLEMLGVKLGDEITLGNATFRIRAVIDYASSRAASTFNLGPMALIHWNALDATGLNTPGVLAKHVYQLNFHRPTDAENWVTAFNRQHPDASWQVRPYTNAASGLRNSINRLSLFLTLVSLAALATAGLGIHASTRQYLEYKQSTIAILKCLGASRRYILKLYALQLLLVALACFALSALSSIGLSGLLLKEYGDRLPVTSDRFFFWQPVLVGMGFALFSLLTFGGAGLLGAMGISPARLLRTAHQEGLMTTHWEQRLRLFLAGGSLLTALAIFHTGRDTFVISFVLGIIASCLLFLLVAVGLEGVARRVSQHSGLSFLLRSALRNLSRPGAITRQVMVAMGLSMGLVMTVAFVSANLLDTLGRNIPKQAPSLFFLDIQPDQMEPFQQLISSYDRAGSFDALPIVRGVITELKGVPASQAEIDDSARWAVRGDRGFTFLANPSRQQDNTLNDGEWWPDGYKGEPLISVDAELAKGLGLKLGDKVGFNILGQEITATVVNTREVNWGSLRMNFAFIFSPGVIDTLPFSYLATVRLEESQETPLILAMKEEFGNISAVRLRETLKQVASLLENISQIILVTSGVSVVMGLLVMASVILSSLERRSYETVVLRVLGLKPRQTRRMLLVEFLLIAFLACAAALLVAVTATRVMLPLFLISGMEFPVDSITILFVAGIITALVMATAVARRIVRVRPLMVLRNE